MDRWWEHAVSRPAAAPRKRGIPKEIEPHPEDEPGTHTLHVGVPGKESWAAGQSDQTQ
jgi:hypothetical protein